MVRLSLALGLLLVLCGSPAWAQLEAPDRSTKEPATGADVPTDVRDEATKEDAAPPRLDRPQATIVTPRFGPEAWSLSVNAALRGGVQWNVGPRRAGDDVFGFGAADLVVTARPTPDITLLVDAEALAGPGPDEALGTLSRLNTDADRIEGRHTRLLLREAWVRVQSSDASVRFNVGKLDVAHYVDRNVFAEDETRRFLNGALINNPLLRPPPNGPGASLRISEGDWRYAVGVHAPDAVDGDLTGLPYVVGELGRRNLFALEGHYRWWTRVSSVPDRRDDVSWGTGVSIDQLVTENTGVFLRAGLGRSGGERLTAHAWSIGAQHSPDWLGRAQDLIGAGLSFQRERAGRERAAEVYYNLAVAECCQLIANVEWINGPDQATGRRHRDAVVPGLRALILF